MSLTAYIKPTNYCSVGCEHCYLPESVREDHSVMTKQTLIDTARLLVDMAKKEKQPNLHIVWHGGEPMMLKPEWYWEACEILDKEIGKGFYTQSFQTSLIPYKSSWKDLLTTRFDSFIGSSIDFSQRKVKSSPEAYLDLWMRKVTNARKDGMYIVPGMVPTKNEIGKGEEIVSWFIKHEFAEFNIERYSKVGGHFLDWPTNKQHGNFLTEVFDSLMTKKSAGLQVPYVKLISSAIGGVLFQIPGERWGGTCQKSFIVIEPDGSLNTCPDRAKHEKPFSNVSDGAGPFILSPERRNWIRIQNVTHKKDHCHACEYQSWCQSGCPVTPNGPSEGQTECSGYKTFLNHVKDFCNTDEGRKIALDYIRPPGEPILQEHSLI